MDSKLKLQKKIKKLIISNTSLSPVLINIVTEYCGVFHLILHRDYGKKLKFFKKCLYNDFRRFYRGQLGNVDSSFGHPLMGLIGAIIAPLYLVPKSCIKTLYFRRSKFNFTEMAFSLEKLEMLNDIALTELGDSVLEIYIERTRDKYWMSSNTAQVYRLLENNHNTSDTDNENKKKIQGIKNYIKNPTNTYSKFHGILLQQLRDINIQKQDNNYSMKEEFLGVSNSMST